MRSKEERFLKMNLKKRVSINRHYPQIGLVAATEISSKGAIMQVRKQGISFGEFDRSLALQDLLACVNQ